MTLKNNRAPLLSNIKLCASFHNDIWIETGVTVRKRLSWLLTYVTLTFDLWPWPFAWTSLLSLVTTSENFMMIRWWEHSQKGVTDGRTDWTIHRAAWSQLKMMPLWKTTCLERPDNLVVALYRFHCICISKLICEMGPDSVITADLVSLRGWRY